MATVNNQTLASEITTLRSNLATELKRRGGEGSV